MKAAIRSALAESDIDSALDYYLVESAKLAAMFIDSLQQATHHIEAHPGTGSPRYSLELNIAGLRHWPLRHFPYSPFYIEHVDHLLVVRLVHMRRDIPASLRDEQ